MEIREVPKDHSWDDKEQKRAEYQGTLYLNWEMGRTRLKGSSFGGEGNKYQKGWKRITQ